MSEIDTGRDAFESRLIKDLETADAEITRPQSRVKELEGQVPLMTKQAEPEIKTP
jgi:hypothetical protein